MITESSPEVPVTTIFFTEVVVSGTPAESTQGLWFTASCLFGTAMTTSVTPPPKASVRVLVVES